MKISVLCSSESHPIYPLLEEWVGGKSISHNIELVNIASELKGGDILFLISSIEIIDRSIRKKYQHCLVIHASNLPKGRGWSPHIWQILEGKNEIFVTLLEAEDKIDSGAIWRQLEIIIEPHELFDEINKKLFDRELQLMDYAIQNSKTVSPARQEEGEPSHYSKRTPQNSELDPDKSLTEQFNLIRVSDPDRYPAYFNLHGHIYELVIRKKVNGHG